MSCGKHVDPIKVLKAYGCLAPVGRKSAHTADIGGCGMAGQAAHGRKGLTSQHVARRLGRRKVRVRARVSPAKWGLPDEVGG
eukprot:2419596-Pyramimonas_sp.AAC.1